MLEELNSNFIVYGKVKSLQNATYDFGVLLKTRVNILEIGD